MSAVSKADQSVETMAASSAGCSAGSMAESMADLMAAMTVVTKDYLMVEKRVAWMAAR